ncbi:uncharacterized protein LOC5519111 [Nematostella vectensis]|uniref:uncharacterized protein LOC5519111 n=1 Tax=Nematostella vectensis TaxID=45351 RepID=UPI002077745E|nr:uncharacterized protein LOC5519111 [Nematostella vectensis]XP_032219767.2 uncharacterized protein LOC5519111 [Nematostella vectensis]
MGEKGKQQYYPRVAMKRIKEVKEYVEYTFEKQQILVLKLFYFFGLSSLSLKVVYMPLYFKQVGLPASYAGILAGIPPFIRGGGALFLGFLADKFNLRRNLFLVSLVANMVIPLLCLIPRVEYPACDLDFTEEPVTDPLGMPYEGSSQTGVQKLVTGQFLSGRYGNNSQALGRTPIDIIVINTTLPNAKPSNQNKKENATVMLGASGLTNKGKDGYKVTVTGSLTLSGKLTYKQEALEKKRRLDQQSEESFEIDKKVLNGNLLSKNTKKGESDKEKKKAINGHVESREEEKKEDAKVQSEKESEIEKKNPNKKQVPMYINNKEKKEITHSGNSEVKKYNEGVEKEKKELSPTKKKSAVREWPEIKHQAEFHRRITRSVVGNFLTKRDERLGIFEFYRRTTGKPNKKTSTSTTKPNNGTATKTKATKNKTPQESHEAMMAIFTTLLLLLIIGEFLGGPMRSLSDLAVLETLGGDKSNYGEVALYMQVGKIFLAPLILVLIRNYPLHVCDVLKDNYEYSLYPLAAFIAISMIFGLSIKFKQEDEDSKIRPEDAEGADKTLYDVIFTFKTFTILVLSFFAGGLSAVHYTFIFWYLTDLSPEDSAMVIAVVIVLRDIVSSISYKLSGRTLGILGPVNTLHLALLLYIISFLSYAVMENPWFAIIPEIVQYIVFPLAYSSFVVYLGRNTPLHLNATVQGIYQCLYYGVGFGVGPLLAGFLFEHVGGAYTFLVFAGISFALLLFSLARHAITRHMDRADDSSYKRVPEQESDEEPATMERDEADY